MSLVEIIVIAVQPRIKLCACCLIFVTNKVACCTSFYPKITAQILQQRFIRHWHIYIDVQSKYVRLLKLFFTTQHFTKCNACQCPCNIQLYILFQKLDESPESQTTDETQNSSNKLQVWCANTKSLSGHMIKDYSFSD